MLKIILINALIFGIVALIVHGKYSPSEEKELTPDSFSATYSKALKVVVTICFLLFAFFFQLNSYVFRSE